MKRDNAHLRNTLLIGLGFAPLIGAVAGALVILSEEWGSSTWWGPFEDDAASFLGFGILCQALAVGLLGWICCRSSESFVTTFSLGPGKLGFWCWPAAVVGTFAAGKIGGVLEEVCFGAGVDADAPWIAGMAGMAEAFWPMLIVVAILPALGEEFLYRGFVQRRLGERLPVPVAILISSLFFAIGHGGLSQAASVFPVGVWFGYLAYRAGSVWISTFAHFVNNASVVLAAWLLATVETTEELSSADTPVEGLGALDFIVPAFLLWGCVHFVNTRAKPRTLVLELGVQGNLAAK